MGLEHCPPLSLIKNGINNVSKSLKYDLDVVTTYACKPGYYLIGNKERRCNPKFAFISYNDERVNANTWSGIDPVCNKGNKI